MNAGTTEKVTPGLKALMHDAEELLKTTCSQTGEKMSHLRDRLGKQLGKAREH